MTEFIVGHIFLSIHAFFVSKRLRFTAVIPVSRDSCKAKRSFCLIFRPEAPLFFGIDLYSPERKQCMEIFRRLRQIMQLSPDFPYQ